MLMKLLAKRLAISLLVLLLAGFAMPILALPGDGSDTLKMTTGRLEHDGIERSYTLYVPHSYDAKTALPLLVLLHGGGGAGKRMIKFTGFDKIASQEGLIVVCPEGYERHWNDGRLEISHKAHEKNIDDVGFISQLIDQIGKEKNIDKSRIYVAGISNGAMMSFRLGLELSNKIAAIGTVVGCLPEPFSTKAVDARPMPAIIFNGTKDPLVPFEGGYVKFLRKTLGKVISAPETAAFWAKHNKCDDKAEEALLTLNGNKSGCTVKEKIYKNCCNNADVEFYSIEGGGHTWHRDSLYAQYLPVMVIGKACRDIDTTELMWSFFKKHRLMNGAAQ